MAGGGGCRARDSSSELRAPNSELRPPCHHPASELRASVGLRAADSAWRSTRSPSSELRTPTALPPPGLRLPGFGGIPGFGGCLALDSSSELREAVPQTSRLFPDLGCLHASARRQPSNIVTRGARRRRRKRRRDPCFHNHTHTHSASSVSLASSVSTLFEDCAALEAGGFARQPPELRAPSSELRPPSHHPASGCRASTRFGAAAGAGRATRGRAECRSEERAAGAGAMTTRHGVRLLPGLGVLTPVSGDIPEHSSRRDGPVRGCPRPARKTRKGSSTDANRVALSLATFHLPPPARTRLTGGTPPIMGIPTVG